MFRTRILAVAFVVLMAYQVSAQADPGTLPHDVIIGTPRPIPYSRAFPLLDGIFQDVAAIQLKPLQLDPNVANASNLNAVLQQLQLSVQYSQIAGIQNSA